MESSSPCQAKRGLVCLRCGSREFLVIYTRRRNGYIARSRECSNCGKRMITRERPVGT